MFYKELRQASSKHISTCQCLINSLDNKSCEDENALLNNIYYLSGYIIETILKYGIYRAINYEKSKEIELLNQDGLVFTKDIKNHRLENLKKIYSSYRSLNYQFPSFRKWNPNQRYIVDKKKKSDVLDFFETSKKLFKECSCY